MKKIFGYLFADERLLSLEHRLFLSSIFVGLVISIIGSVMAIILSLKPLPIVISLSLSCFLSVIYYFARFKGIIRPFILPILLFSITGIFSIWILAGGIKGPNLLPASVILIFALLIVPVKYRPYIFLLFIACVIVVHLLQYFKPEIIVDYPTETSRWIDSIITAMYCSFSIYLIINFIHKHYTIERLRAEKNETYNVMTNQLKDWISLADMNGNIISANKALSEMTGFSESELLRMSLFDLESKSPSQPQGLINENKTNREGLPCVLRIKRKDNTEFIAEMVTNIIKISDQTFLLSTGKDVTERNKLEEALKEREEIFHSIFENNSAAMAIIEPDTTISMVNQEYCKISGYSRQEIIGTSWTRQIPPEDLDRLKEYNRLRLIKSKEAPDQYEFTFYHKNGQVRHSMLAITMLNNRKIIASFVDITERKLNEEKMRQLSDRLSLAVRAGGVGVWDYDIVNNILLWDDQMFTLYGIDKNKFSGAYEAWRAGLHPDDRVRGDEEIQMAIRGEKDFDTEFRVLWPDSTIRNIRALAIVKHDHLGNPLRMIGTNWDITIQKQAEQDLIQAKEKAEESDRLKSAFLANMSHEIRTPMNGILGFTQLMKEPELTSDEQRSYIHIIEKSGARLLNIINDVVNMSKIEAGQMEITLSEVNVKEKIEFIYAFFKPEADQKKIHFLRNHKVSDTEVIIKTDPEKIYAILTNLVKNALKFTLEGSVEFGYEKKGENLEFYVNDTGIGIRPEYQQIIFERFMQGDKLLTKNYEGTGLGLSITKAYVEMLGGKIWLESELGKGSTFYFTIPYNVVTDSKSFTSEVSLGLVEEKPGKTLKIMIAEDDETSAMLIAKVVNKTSHDLMHAFTGVEAIDACRNNPGIDLVLMDINMPELNGYEATRQIRKFNKNVIIIAQTAYALAGDREKAMEAGCNDYISKPLNNSLLLELIHKYFK